MNKKSNFKKFLPWTIFVLIIVLFLFFRPVERVQFNNQNMEPTYKQGQTAWLISPENLLGSIKRGDIVSFDIKKDSKYFTSVARVIAIPGDSVMIKDGAVYLNNEKLSEPYAQGATATKNLEAFPEGKIIILSEDEYFLLSDNREKSELDSRSVGIVSGTPNLKTVLDTESYIKGKILDF